MVAGLSGGSGKTLVSLSLLLEARRRGFAVRAFKKGPDYIDTAWLSWASCAGAHNLDTYLMGFERTLDSFTAHAINGGINLIEGNRGLFDGVDTKGSHSTAELAKLLEAPVVLVVNATKMTRTAAALVLGCQKLDESVRLIGVILNQVAGKRHEMVLRGAIESACGIPVLGAIPKVQGSEILPSRHLGLITPEEFTGAGALASQICALAGGRIDMDRLLETAHRSPHLCSAPVPVTRVQDTPDVKIGYVSDSAFTFYYSENLDALRAGGADLVPVSALRTAALPDDLDGLYIGGGYPETHAEALAGNTGFLRSLRHAACEGLPIYAECGGLMLLSRSLYWNGASYPMASALPFSVEVCNSPQGHAYVELQVDTLNAFYPRGLRIKGHEFHYSKIIADACPPATACAVLRGAGCYNGRDGIIFENVWASYAHVHAVATPEWARGFLSAARRFAKMTV